MSQSQDTRPPVQGHVGRGSKDASIRLTAFNGLGSASSAFRNDPQALLGLSTGPSPMSISCTGLSNLRRTSGSDQHIYTGNNISSDYHSPHDLELTEPQDCQQESTVYPVPQNTNGNVADPLQRLTSAEPQQLPWSGIHLNGVPPSQPTRESAQNSSRNSRMGPQRSLIGSHANETDEGYHTYSQHDLHSVYSGASSQMYYTRPGPSSVPRSMPSTRGQPGLANYSANPVYRSLDLQFAQPLDQQNPSQVHQNRGQQEPFHCDEPDCPYTCKTQSDLKKHIARHKKPHVCDQSGCARAEKGFATVNDLERHQKTVHSMEPAHGQSRMYKCFAPNCKQHSKEWPRQDNFKQHLLRMHKGEDTEALLQRSIHWYDTEKKPRQTASEIESSESSLQPSSSNQPYRGSSDHHQTQNFLSPTWQPSSNAVRRQQANIPNRPRHQSFSGQTHASPSHALSSDGNQLVQTTFSANPSQFSYQFRLDNSHHIPRGRFTSAYTVPNPEISALSEVSEMNFPSYSPSFATPQNDLAQIASNFSSEQQNDLPPSDHELHSPNAANEAQQHSRRISFSIEDLRAFFENNAAGGQKIKDAAFLERIMKAGCEKLAESQQQSTTAKTTSSSSSVITSTATTQPDSSDICLTYRCPEEKCNKTFSRPCDLKKHQKRHDRPYGCTFSKCYEKFGSKYDWKRHETYQHHQQECWKCDLCSNAAAKNGKSLTTTTSQLFYKRRLYEDHLRSTHSSSPDMIHDLVGKQRIGRNCQSRFWCGFCVKILVLEKKGLDGANERFNHIDDHFKKGHQIDQWVEMDGSVAKGEQQAGREEDDESVEDVLGADGINSREDDEDVDEDDSGGERDRPSSSSRVGQKRSRPSEFETSSSASSDHRSARRQRSTYPDPNRSTRTKSRAAYMVTCHSCGNGPCVWKHSERCPDCQHDFCTSCNYETMKPERMVQTTDF